MLKGSLVALITPFTSERAVNYQELTKLIDYHLENQTDGLVILGTTAETTTLSQEEQEKIVALTIEQVDKRIPVIVGAGSNDTSKAMKLAVQYSQMGADYLLVVTPYYNKTNTAGLIKHFTMIADSSSCPIVLYNVPSRTCMNIPAQVIEVISTHPNIVGIKEASGDISYTSTLVKYLNDEFVLLSGNDDIIVPMMSIGATGVISVLANIAPTQTHNICKLCLENRYEEARAIQITLLDFINALFIETNPIPIKEAMTYFNFHPGGYRMPLDYISEAAKVELISCIEAVKGAIF